MGGAARQCWGSRSCKLLPLALASDQNASKSCSRPGVPGAPVQAVDVLFVKNVSDCAANRQRLPGACSAGPGGESMLCPMLGFGRALLGNSAPPWRCLWRSCSLRCNYLKHCSE